MRTLFIPCKTRRNAQRIAPWAARIVKACGGYWCFESLADYAMWSEQR